MYCWVLREMPDLETTTTLVSQLQQKVEEHNRLNRADKPGLQEKITLLLERLE